MKISNRFTVTVATAALGVVIAGASLTPPSNADTGSAGKAVVTAKCIGCHGPQLQGRPGFAPNISGSGVLKLYTKAQFEKLMMSGVGANGKQVKPAMPTWHFAPAQADPIYADLKSTK